MRRITPDQVNDFARMMGGDRNDPASVRRRIEALEAVLERAFIVPGINRPIGLDAIVGLIPVVGDLLAALMSAYVILEARNLGSSKWHLARMGPNHPLATATAPIPPAGE